MSRSRDAQIRKVAGNLDILLGELHEVVASLEEILASPENPPPDGAVEVPDDRA